MPKIRSQALARTRACGGIVRSSPPGGTFSHVSSVKHSLACLCRCSHVMKGPWSARGSAPGPRLAARSGFSGRDGRGYLSGEADLQDEVPEPQVECSAAGPVHDECQQDDGQNDDHHPEEEHNDGRDRISRYCSGSSHDRQLPGAARRIRRKNPNVVRRFPPPLSCAAAVGTADVAAVNTRAGVPAGDLVEAIDMRAAIYQRPRGQGLVPLVQ
jgi:hypothetical protein